MIAFISDIHSNTAALGACLRQIEAVGADRIICLGDVIGYGPEPRETLLKIIEVCEFSMLGNHEHGSMFYASDFNPKARIALDWTRDQLNLRDCPREENMRLWNYLSDMRQRYEEDNFLLVHGSPRDPIKEYMVPRDVEDSEKMGECFEQMGDAQLCFVGHSHVPGVYEEFGGFKTPEDLGGNYDIGEGRALINVGSVGQPRDGDTRATFATLNESTVNFHRVEYDIQTTQEKIRAIPELPDDLAERLEKGR
ncbi:MAG: metallophosphoesterase family protein [Planctomycetota bacterium]|jgi:diadenosine tetraphosphatase ApaH/serine/threonine PP2A family protein phosphatase